MEEGIGKTNSPPATRAGGIICKSLQILLGRGVNGIKIYRDQQLWFDYCVNLNLIANQKQQLSHTHNHKTLLLTACIRVKLSLSPPGLGIEENNDAR